MVADQLATAAPSSSSSSSSAPPFVCSARVMCDAAADRAPIYGCAFNPYAREEDAPQLATAGANSVVLYQSMPSQGAFVPFYVFHDNETGEEFYTVTWAFDALGGSGALILAAGRHGHIRVLSAGRACALRTLYGHGAAVNELRTSPADSLIVASASADHTARLWNVLEKAALAVFGGLSGHLDQVLTCDFSLSGRALLTGAMDHRVMAWALGPGTRVHEVYERSVRECTEVARQQPLFFQTPDCACDTIQINMSEVNYNRDEKLRPVAHVEFPVSSTNDLHTNYVDCVRLVGPFVLSKSSENCVMLWKFGDLSDGVCGRAARLHVETHTQLLAELHVPDADNWFVKFNVDPKNEWLVVPNQHGKLFAWKLRGNLGPAAEFTMQPKQAAIRQIDWEPFGRCFVTVDDVGCLYQVDVTSRNVQHLQSLPSSMCLENCQQYKNRAPPVLLKMRRMNTEARKSAQEMEDLETAADQIEQSSPQKNAAPAPVATATPQRTPSARAAKRTPTAAGGSPKSPTTSMRRRSGGTS